MKKTAQIIVINDEGFILSVSRKNNHLDIGIPGGKMEDCDITIEDCAVRELKEETGITVNPKDLINVYTNICNGTLSYTFVATAYSGEIDYNEPHVVCWGSGITLTKGSFGEYNNEVLRIVKALNINFKWL